MDILFSKRCLSDWTPGTYKAKVSGRTVKIANRQFVTIKGIKRKTPASAIVTINALGYATVYVL